MDVFESESTRHPSLIFSLILVNWTFAIIGDYRYCRKRRQSATVKETP